MLVQTNQDKVTKTLDNLNDTLVRVSSVFTEENQKNLTATLKNVRAGSENLEAITKSTDEMLKEGKTTIKRVNEAVVKAGAHRVQGRTPVMGSGVGNAALRPGSRLCVRFGTDRAAFYGRDGKRISGNLRHDQLPIRVGAA